MRIFTHLLLLLLRLASHHSEALTSPSSSTSSVMSTYSQHSDMTQLRKRNSLELASISSASSSASANEAVSNSTPPSPPSLQHSGVEDYTTAASALFGNVRIPAALFAGAATASAFALLPLQNGVDTLRLGMGKRIYAIIMLAALSSQIVTVVVSTMTVTNMLSTPPLTGSTQDEEINSFNTTTQTTLCDFIMKHYELEWLTVRLHFLGGVLLFLTGIGLRAWLTIGCPVFANAAVGIVLSTTCLCFSFRREWDDSTEALATANRNTAPFLWLIPSTSLPWKYGRALWRRVTSASPGRTMFSWLGISMILTLMTLGYILANIPHVSQYLIVSSPSVVS